MFINIRKKYGDLLDESIKPKLLLDTNLGGERNKNTKRVSDNDEKSIKTRVINNNSSVRFPETDENANTPGLVEKEGMSD